MYITIILASDPNIITVHDYRFLNKLGFSRKKKTTLAKPLLKESKKLRLQYWEQVKHINPDNLVFLDETGMLLGGNRHYAPSQKGTRAGAEKPF